MTPISENKMFGGVQSVYEHRSDACNCDMKVAVFMPPQALGKDTCLLYTSPSPRDRG